MRLCSKKFILSPAPWLLSFALAFAVALQPGCKKQQKQRAYVPVPPLMTKIQGKDEKRVLKAAFALEVGSEKDKREIEGSDKISSLRDAYVDYLSTRSVTQVQSPKAKKKLLKKLEKIAQKEMPDRDIRGVYFNQFVFQ